MDWYNNEACIQGIFPLAESCSSEITPDWIEDFCNFSDCLDQEILDALPSLKPYLKDRNQLITENDFVETISWNRVKGYLIKFSWFKRTYQEDGSFYSGPGYTRFKWIFATDVEAGIKCAYEILRADHKAAEAKVAGQPPSRLGKEKQCQSTYPSKFPRLGTSYRQNMFP